jgi:hypothetical protein
MSVANARSSGRPALYAYSFSPPIQRRSGLKTSHGELFHNRRAPTALDIHPLEPTPWLDYKSPCRRNGRADSPRRVWMRRGTARNSRFGGLAIDRPLLTFNRVVAQIGGMGVFHDFGTSIYGSRKVVHCVRQRVSFHTKHQRGAPLRQRARQGNCASKISRSICNH